MEPLCGDHYNGTVQKSITEGRVRYVQVSPESEMGKLCLTRLKHFWDISDLM